MENERWLAALGAIAVLASAPACTERQHEPSQAEASPAPQLSSSTLISSDTLKAQADSALCVDSAGTVTNWLNDNVPDLPWPVDTASAPWFDSLLVPDVTGDGVPDTLELRAYGSKSDSLTMIFEIRSGGVLFRRVWDSPYELIDQRHRLSSPEAVDAYMRAALAGFFTRLTISPLDESAGNQWEHLPPPLRVDLRRGIAPVILIMYGYESHEVFSWSWCAGRFIVLEGCC